MQLTKFPCRRGAYLTLSILASGPLVACGDPEVFDRVGATPPPAGAPWPRLAANPPTAPAGVYGPATPDPAIGDATRIELAVAGASAAERARKIEGPVR